MAVTAAVAVAAVLVGSALGVLVVGPLTAGARLGSAADFVPADAAAYVELRVVPDSEQDAALRELIGRFPVTGLDDGDRPLVEQLAELIQGDSAGDFKYEDDVAPWFDGSVALAVTDAGAGAAMPAVLGAGGMPEGFAMFGVRDRAAAVAATDRMRAHAEGEGASFRSETHDGVTVWSSIPRAATRHDMGIAYAVTDDRLIVAFDAEHVVAALETRASGETFRERDDLEPLLSALPDSWLALAVFDSSEMASATAVAGQPTLGALTLSAEGDRLVLDAVSEAPTGELAVANARRGLAEQIPSDALVYFEGGNVGTSLSAAIEGFMDQMPVAPSQPGPGFDQLLGEDPARYVRWIGDAAGMVGWRDGELYGGLLLVPTDADEAAERMDDLIGLARLAAIDESSGITITEETIVGAEVTTIRLSDSGAEASAPEGAFMMTEIVVQVSVAPERVLIGIGDDFVPSVLELDEADSLAANDRYADIVDQLRGDDNTGAVWVDLAGAREAFEDAFGSDAAGMFDMYTDDIRPWLLPLDRLAAVSWIDGDLCRTRGVLTVE